MSKYLGLLAYTTAHGVQIMLWYCCVGPTSNVAHVQKLLHLLFPRILEWCPAARP